LSITFPLSSKIFNGFLIAPTLLAVVKEALTVGEIPPLDSVVLEFSKSSKAILTLSISNPDVS
jgi:hypothetical protein